MTAHMKGAVANEKDVLYMTSSPFIIKLYAVWLKRGRFSKQNTTAGAQETYNTKTFLCFLLEVHKSAEGLGECKHRACTCMKSLPGSSLTRKMLEACSVLS